MYYILSICEHCWQIGFMVNVWEEDILEIIDFPSGFKHPVDQDV